MHILELVKIDNIADEVEDQILDDIGQRVIEEYEIDLTSMSDWADINDIARKLIDPKPEERSDPWPGAANTKLPLILNAAMKVSAEEGAEILRGKEMVSYEVFGQNTPEKTVRAQRVAKRMNFQYRHEMEDWVEDHDRLILAKNLFGVVHKKYFFSPEMGRTECVLRLGGVVVNDNVTRLSEAPRVSDVIEKFWWQAEEKFRSGQWKEIELSTTTSNEFAQKDKVNEFIEQIRREDLDEDGYPEPYVVTVHRQTKKVVRIAPNYTLESIKFKTKDGMLSDNSILNELPENEFKTALKALKVVRVDLSKARVRYVKYEMVPDFDGGYWGWGFGILLGALTENSNTLVNQLLNQGSLANSTPIFVSQTLRMGHGEVTVGPGEVISVNAPGGDIQRSFAALPVSDPSQTLFGLLGLLMDTIRELSSVTEVVSGNQPEANMPAASIAMLIEQGKKSFGSIYERHYRSLGKEFGALFDLNFLYEDPVRYAKFHDAPIDEQQPMALIQGDFERDELDVLPAANPKFSTRLQRIGEVQTLKQGLAESPNANVAMLDRMFADAVLDDTEKAAEIVPDEPNMTPRQAMEEMERAKKEFMDSAEARTAEAKAATAELELQIVQVQADVEGVKGPLEIDRQRLLNETAEGKTIQAIAGSDTAQWEEKKKQKEIELMEVKIEKERVEIAAQKAETRAFESAEAEGMSDAQLEKELGFGA